MDVNPYATTAAGPTPYQVTPPPADTQRHEPPGYAENQPGRQRIAAGLPTGYVQAPTPPSAVSVSVLGYGTAALLAGQVVLMLCAAGASTWAVVSFAGVGSGGEPVAADGVQGLLMMSLYLSMPACGIAFATWLCLATRNARSWGSRTRRGPGWAFGAWFVPIVNWWFPKQMVDDVWRGSHPGLPDGAPLHLVARPASSLVWWTTWLGAPVLVQVGAFQAVWPLIEQVVAAVRSGATTPPAPDLAAIQGTMALWSVWAYGLWAICALAAAAFVVQITSWQRAKLSPARS